MDLRSEKAMIFRKHWLQVKGMQHKKLLLWQFLGGRKTSALRDPRWKCTANNSMLPCAD